MYFIWETFELGIKQLFHVIEFKPQGKPCWKVDHGLVGEPFFEFDEQEIHEANLANGSSSLANIFFYFDLSLVKRNEGPNFQMSKYAS